MTHVPFATIEDYEPLIGAESVRRILEKAKKLQDAHIVNINSTYYGGGVAELLSSMTLLLNGMGIKTGWRVIQGSPDFFSVTKKMHNALQGDTINLTDRKTALYDDVILENALRNHLDRNEIVIVHDPQPLGLIRHYEKRGPWIWRCHIDLSRPNRDVWNFLKPTVDLYDAVILSVKDYRKRMKPPQFFFMPAIDPFSIKNREMTEAEIEERLNHYNIPTDLPIVTQISRFDPWKDPEGVIEAYKIARKETPCTLVLLGNPATDDPEGERIYGSIMKEKDDRIIVLFREDTALVNALQRKAAVVLQKSVREGFGLTVAEAMWKSNAVIGGDVGGIRYQIKDGENGFLVSSPAEAADRMVRLLKDPKRRTEMGQKAREVVRRQFLLSRYVEQYLDLFGSIETLHQFKSPGWFHG